MIYKYFRCNLCKKVSTSGQWDVETRQLCKTADGLKTYRPISKAGHAPKWYQCPKCHKPSERIHITPMHKDNSEAQPFVPVGAVVIGRVPTEHQRALEDIRKRHQSPIEEEDFNE